MVINQLKKFVFIIFFLFHACIPSLSKNFMQSVSDFLQLRSILNPGPFQITVRVSGLVGSGLTLSLNSGLSSLTVNTDGDYSFPSQLLTGQSFTVTITNQPVLPTQTCSVSGGSGVIGFGNINSIIVNCDPLRYTLGGTISGLDGATGLTLTNAFDGSTLPVAVASGTFAFTQTYVSGSTYNVTVTTQPNHPVQNCIVTNGSGTFASANITNITINCTSTAFPIEITAIGIGSGILRLSNNGSETIDITTNGLHRFPTNLPPSSTYQIQIVSSPPEHQCVLSSSAGIVAGTVSIQANCFSILTYKPRNGGVLLPNESIRLVFSAEVNTGSCSGSTGTLSNTTLALPVNFTLATTNLANDTLLATPAPTDTWQAGHRNLTLNCVTNVGSHPLSTNITLSYLIPSNIRYVSDVGGLDGNDGLTTATPKRNIQAAIDSFGGCPTGDCAVLVAQGSYDPAAIADRILLASGISLFGSYEPGFSDWKPEDKDSTILMDTVPASCAAATASNPCASIVADATITTPVVISGFTILSGDTAPHMAGVFINSTNNVRLIDNVIKAGKGMDGSAGVNAINSSPVILLNQIDGGSCTMSACTAAGLLFSSSSLIAPFIVGNRVDGGSPPLTLSNASSVGLRYSGSVGINVTNIRQNIFTAKNLNVVEAVSTTKSFAFEIGTTSNSSTGILANNQFNHGQAHRSYGIYIQSATSLQIGSATEGNLITGAADSISESIGIRITTFPLTIRRNTINLGSTLRNAGLNTTAGIYFDNSGGGNSIIENNRIIGGSATEVANSASSILHGIYAPTLGASSSISGNLIRLGSSTGGTSSLVAGITTSNSGAALIANNWIQNGTSNGNARGINLSSIFSPLRVFHNTVSSGSNTPGNDAAIYITGFSNSMLIENNILLMNADAVGNACIFNVNGSSGAIRYNVFYNCANFVSQGVSNYTELCTGGVPGGTGCLVPLPMGTVANFGNNLNLNPNLVTNFGIVSNYIPTAATSCLITKSPNVLLSDSFNGMGTRPGGDGAVSIGAIEYDLPCTP